jgi:PAS domain S-box-containing protein
VARATDEQHLLAEVCRCVVESGRYRLAWVGYAEHDDSKTVRPVAQFGFDDGYTSRVGITWAETERGKGPTGLAIRTGRAAICTNILTDPAFEPWREDALRRGYCSSIALPLAARGQVLGALNVYAEEPDAFDSEEARLLTELADSLASGIAALRDRAECKQAEKTQLLHSLVLESAPSAIAIADLTGKLSYVNRAFLDMWGYTEAQQVVGRPAVGFWRNPKKATEAVTALPTSGAWSGEITAARADGSEFDALISAGIVKDDTGNPVGMMASFSDVTEARRAERRMGASNALLQLFVTKPQRNGQSRTKSGHFPISCVSGGVRKGLRRTLRTQQRITNLGRAPAEPNS